MNTGKPVWKSKSEPHLDKDEWLEVWPDGSAKDHGVILSIPQNDRTCSHVPVKHGQSPLLVRRSAWERVKSKGE